VPGERTGCGIGEAGEAAVLCELGWSGWVRVAVSGGIATVCTLLLFYEEYLWS